MVAVKARNKRRQGRLSTSHSDSIVHSSKSNEQENHESKRSSKEEKIMPIAGPQRDAVVRKALKRYVRNTSLPEEVETLRYNLIAARVLSGMTAVEAAGKFGYANSTQLSLIESGDRLPPRDWAFLRQASQVYSVSVDFLLGLSPHTELDGEVAQQHALMRGTEAILSNLAASFATTMIKYTEQTQPIPEEFQRVSDAVERTEVALSTMRERYGFDDMPGGAPLMAAVDSLSNSIAPLRTKLKKFRSISGYFDDMRAGRIPVVPYLMERYNQADVLSDF